MDSLIDSKGISVQKGALSQKRYSKIANLFWISWQTGSSWKNFFD